MLKKFIKLFVRQFIKPEALAQYGAESIKNAVNNSEKRDLIAKYGTMADKATEVQKQITDWLKDGQIDDKETEEIQKMLLPLFENLMKLI